MTAPLYPDAAIDRAIRQAMSFATYHAAGTPSAKRQRDVRAEMIRIRDAAGPRVGATPTDADLETALGLRARDLFGLSDPNGWYAVDTASRN